MDTSAWVTRPERPKCVKDEVKRPEGPQLEVGVRRAPTLLVVNNCFLFKKDPAIRLAIELL